MTELINADHSRISSVHETREEAVRAYYLLLDDGIAYHKAQLAELKRKKGLKI